MWFVDVVPHRCLYSCSSVSLTSGASNRREPKMPSGGLRERKSEMMTDVDRRDLESGSRAPKDKAVDSGGTAARDDDWEKLLGIRNADYDVLKMLETATGSGTGTSDLTTSSPKNQVLLRYVPFSMRWDAFSTRIREFHVEMRMISRLRVSFSRWKVFTRFVHQHLTCSAHSLFDR